MRVSELIEILEKEKERVGDVEVVVMTDEGDMDCFTKIHLSKLRQYDKYELGFYH